MAIPPHFHVPPWSGRHGWYHNTLSLWPTPPTSMFHRGLVDMVGTSTPCPYGQPLPLPCSTVVWSTWLVPQHPVPMANLSHFHVPPRAGRHGWYQPVSYRFRMRAGARAEGLGCRNGCVHCERVKVRQCNAQLCTYMFILDGLWFVASVLVLKLFVYSHFTVFLLFFLPGSSVYARRYSLSLCY